MTDFPSLSRMPGSDSVFADDEFDPGERAGMRTAGWILIAGAAIELLTALFDPNPRGIVTLVIDGVLGIQLLRLRHSWRVWVMVRAVLGAALAAFALLIGVVGGVASFAAVTTVTGVIIYCAAILLLLYSRPTLRRIRVGQWVFAVSLVIIVAGGILTEMAATPAAVAPPSRSMPSAAVVGDADVILAGPTAEDLRAEDLREIGDLIAQAGEPWLILGQWPEQGRRMEWPVEVFFAPDVTKPEIRRGPSATLIGRLADDPADGTLAAASWTLSPVPMRYAQVAVERAGRPFMTTGADSGKPFMLPRSRAGELIDQDVVDIVRVLRTNPTGSGRVVNGAWPIDRMLLIAPDVVEVVLSDPDAGTRSGQKIFMRAIDGAWMILEVGPWAI